MADEKPEAPDRDVPSGAFLTGVEIDVDQWRLQTIEELQTWLSDIQTRKTSMGDPLVDFPEGWDTEKVLTQKQQLDIIQQGLASTLTGPEAREAQAELQTIRAQAEKIRQLDKLLNQLEEDDDEGPIPEEPGDEDLLNTDIVIPKIDTSGPNPFELTPEVQARLKAIDEKLGWRDEDDAAPTKSLDEINDDLLKLYQEPATEPEAPDPSAEPEKPPAAKPESTPAPAPTPAPPARPEHAPKGRKGK